MIFYKFEHGFGRASRPNLSPFYMSWPDTLDVFGAGTRSLLGRAVLPAISAGRSVRRYPFRYELTQFRSTETL